MTGAGLAAAGVVVPARDEAALLGRCLDAVAVAAVRACTAHPELTVDVVVVLDRCRDGSAAVAAARPVHVVEVDVGSAGAARRAGVERLQELGAARRTSPEQSWVASTDADTVVPEQWLDRHLALARAGAKLVLGRALPDPTDLRSDLLTEWHRRHDDQDLDLHVHGANLGFRLDAYLDVGGFPPTPEHEDVDLVARFRSIGIEAHRGPAVVTSGRTRGRTPGGFAGYLRNLAGVAESGADLSIEQP